MLEREISPHALLSRLAPDADQPTRTETLRAVLPFVPLPDALAGLRTMPSERWSQLSPEDIDALTRVVLRCASSPLACPRMPTTSEINAERARRRAAR